MDFIKKVFWIVWKDIRVEFKTKETVGAMLVFALLVVTVFSFAFDPTKEQVRLLFPGVLWVCFLFAGNLGLSRSFTREELNNCMEGLMLCPTDRTVIYFGKVLGNLVLVGIVEVVTLPVFVVFFNYRLEGSLGMLALVMLLGTFGYVAVGTLLAALAANTRTSELLLPIILFPVAVPVILGSVESTTAILGGASWAEYAHWIRLLAVYAVLFSVLPFLLFDYLLEG